METGEPLNLLIETETTVQGDTASCETTTQLLSVGSLPQQDPETEIIAGRDLMETGEHLNLPIDIETTLEEDSVSSETTATSQLVASAPHQDPETEIIAGRDLIETGEHGIF